MSSVRNQLLRIFLFVLVLFFTPLLWRGAGGEAAAQTYPVQLTTQLIPPYSGYILDYADPTSEKLRLILQFNDFTVPQYNIRLKLEIKGNGFTIMTKQLFNPPPINVQPGVPILISGTDLAPYLNSNNLDFIGINQSQYEQGKALPEGHYSICVKAFDYYLAGTQVSNESCAQAWFTLSDPPFLNLPICNTTVEPQTPQNILFQWTPMNMGSPNSAFSTEYDFELWEIRPDSTANPDQVVLSTAPIYKITTQQTLLNYGITEPELTLFMKYAWRVRARDINGYDLFKNKGYSQVCTFSHGSSGNMLADAYALTLSAQGVTHRLGKCIWNLQSVFTNYLLQVRKSGTANWFDYHTALNTEKITNLEPNTNYEARVRGEGSDILTGQWSNTATFTTLKDPVYNCNDPSMPTAPLQASPLPADKAVAGLVIQTGQFEVVVTEISSDGGTGWYKGKGYAKVFGFFPLAVEWKSIYIDDNNRHQQGIIEAVTKGISSWTHQWDMLQAEENATYTNGTIDSLYINGNQVCIILQGNTNALCYPIPPDANVFVIRDEDGNQYTVTTNPPPAKIEGPTNYLVPSTDVLDANDSALVTFSASATQKYGFDKKEYTTYGHNYELIKLKNEKNYFVPHKSIGESQSDEVMADVQIKNFDKNLLSFKTNNGTVLSSAVGNTATQYKVTVPDYVSSVYAWYNNKKIGKLNIQIYKPIFKKLVLVPVNSSSLPSGGPGWAALNDIYKQANINWTVSSAANFLFDFGGDGLEFPDATLMTKYSAEMRALRDAYRKTDTAYDKNAYYVFVVPEFSNPTYKGYMVRGRAVGFVTPLSFGEGPGVRHAAHELAHGAFGLEHTFPAIDKSTTNNLMDYSSGTNLTKKQWDEMQSSKFIYNWLDSEEDAAIVDGRVFVLETLNKIRTAYLNNKSADINTSTGNMITIYDTYLAGIKYPFIKLVTNVNSIYPKKENVIEFYEPYLPDKYGLQIEGQTRVYVPQILVSSMKDYITTNPGKNILLFVNGYRKNISWNLEEFPNSVNNVYQADVLNYWGGMDADFINRIGTKNAVYADGHHKIYTSNHLTLGTVASSFASSWEQDQAVIRDESRVILDTIPNPSGFNMRKNYGSVAGNKMYMMMLSKTIPCTIDSKGNIVDTVDVVAHSMGFAYAQGMIEALRSHNIKVKRYYIIAPENGCSGTIIFNSFEEIWQYGSQEAGQGRDKRWEQDGIAPQCPVTGLPSGNRVYYPKELTKGFIHCHLSGNYGWIFNKPFGVAGYVKKRK